MRILKLTDRVPTRVGKSWARRERVVVVTMPQPTPSVILSRTPNTTNTVPGGMSTRNLQDHITTQADRQEAIYPMRKKAPPTRNIPDTRVNFVPIFGSYYIVRHIQGSTRDLNLQSIHRAVLLPPDKTERH